jgi:hypothetical protein
MTLHHRIVVQTTILTEKGIASFGHHGLGSVAEESTLAIPRCFCLPAYLACGCAVIPSYAVPIATEQVPRGRELSRCCSCLHFTSSFHLVVANLSDEPSCLFSSGQKLGPVALELLNRVEIWCCSLEIDIRMASFGFSVSDIVMLTSLVTQTYRGWKNACGSYTEITGELRTMRTIVARLEKEVKSSSSLLRRDEKDSSDLRHILTNSQATVSQLNDIVEYRHLDRSRKQNWNRLRVGNKNLEPLQGRLTLHVSELSTPLEVLGISSLGRIELETPPKMMKTFDELAAAVRAGRSEGSIMTAYSNDNCAVWREFRRELIMEGFSSKEIHRHKQELKDYLRKLAESGSLEEKVPCSPSDEAQSVVDNVFDELVEQAVGSVLHVKDDGTGLAETQEKGKLKSTMTADDDKSARMRAETTMLNLERESERESGEIGIESRRTCDPPEDTQNETLSSLSSFSPGRPLEGPEPLYDPYLLKMQMQLKAAIRYQKAARALDKTRGKGLFTGRQLIKKRDSTPSLFCLCRIRIVDH